MSEQIKTQIANWWPVILRGFLWVMVSSIPVLLANLKSLTPEKLAAMSWVDWTIIWFELVLAACTALRLYIDQSLADHKEELNGKLHPEIPKP